MMVQQTSSTPSSSTSRSGTQSVLLYGRLPDRMGSQLAGPSTLRTMVSSRAASTYQLAGVGSCQISHSSLGTSMVQSNSQSVLRQQYSSSVHSKTRRNSFHIPFSQDSGIISSPRSICYNPNPNTSPGSSKCDSRRFITPQQSQSHGMASSCRETLRNLFCVFRTSLVDMFATAKNEVTPIYVSPYPDDRVWAVDALSISWDGLRLIYAFPPAPIVPKTLDRIRYSHGMTVILIALQHPSRLWHPLLLQLSLRPRLRLWDVALYRYVPNLCRPQFHEIPYCWIWPCGYYPGIPQTTSISRICSGNGSQSSQRLVHSCL